METVQETVQLYIQPAAVQTPAHLCKGAQKHSGFGVFLRLFIYRKTDPLQADRTAKARERKPTVYAKRSGNTDRLRTHRVSEETRLR